MLHELQRAVADILHNTDPLSALDEVLTRKNWSDEERRWLEQLNREGVILASLCIRKLRFERLTEGEPELGALFDQQPEQFMSMYAAFTEAVPPVSYFPVQEAEWFRRWQENPEVRKT